jgi:hypothetical protein
MGHDLLIIHDLSLFIVHPLSSSFIVRPTVVKKIRDGIQKEL